MSVICQNRLTDVLLWNTKEYILNKVPAVFVVIEGAGEFIHIWNILKLLKRTIYTELKVVTLTSLFLFNLPSPYSWLLLQSLMGCPIHAPVCLQC